MRKTISSLFFLLILLFSAYALTPPDDPPVSPSERIAARVLRIVDGDTIVAQIRGKQERVRMIGMDTPETKKEGVPVQYYGREASSYAKTNLTGKTVFLEFDAGERDKYGRLLAYVWHSPTEADPRKMFNSKLLLQGYARLLTIPPNVRHVDHFKKYQDEARKNRAGLWR